MRQSPLNYRYLSSNIPKFIKHQVRSGLLLSTYFLLLNYLSISKVKSQKNSINESFFNKRVDFAGEYGYKGFIKNLCIEVAVQMSTMASRQALIHQKGNHRRTLHPGMDDTWGCRKYLQHSFARRGAITFDEFRM